MLLLLWLMLVLVATMVSVALVAQHGSNASTDNNNNNSKTTKKKTRDMTAPDAGGEAEGRDRKKAEVATEPSGYAELPPVVNDVTYMQQQGSGYVREVDGAKVHIPRDRVVAMMMADLDRLEKG